MKASNVLLGIIGGLAAGAILGILYAPEKGSETRKKISKKSGDIKDNLKESFNDLLSNVEDKYNNLASKGSKMVDDASDNLEKMNKELKR
ncbi:YtxH domain-containing protein [Flavobacterium sp.]